MSATTRHSRNRKGIVDAALPTTMRAARIHEFGDPAVFSIESVPVPQAGSREVLIRVAVAGVGSWDPKIRSGEWADEIDAELPLVLGLDGSGTVAAVGAGVDTVRPGDRVHGYNFGNAKGGWYAEYIAIPANKVAPIPRGMSVDTGGALPAIGLTALQGIDDTLEIAPGENVIIHGASGSVGMLALQFAKMRGARVLALASGPDGVEFVRRLGADAAIDGKTGDIEAAAQALAPDGMDAVLAFVGGKELTRCLDTLKDDGRVAYPNGIEPEPRKRHGLRIDSYDAESGVRPLERLNAAIETSGLQVPIAEAFPLDDVASAHVRVERGHLLGRVILKVGP